MGKPENLVIVESPSKAKTIGKYLGDDYVVKASMGHLRDLPKSTMGVDLEHDFTPHYIPVRGKESLIKELKTDAEKAKTVYLATDPDREGEAISWHLKELLNLPDGKAQRVTFNEITQKVVKESIRHPRDIDYDLVDAQQARRILDRIVGYELSPLLWKKIRRGLSAGRVQSVATRLVVDRENEIRAFQPKEYWTLDVTLNRMGKPGAFVAHYWGEEKKRELENEADTLAVIGDIDGKEFDVTNVKKAEKKRYSAPPFTTSTLQQEASRKLGFTPKKTMMVAQQLYEGVDVAGEGTTGLITYMRTDSLRLSDEAMDAAAGFIRSRYGNEYYYGQHHVFKTKAGAQDAHEAIRPVDVNITPEMVKAALPPDQYNLYRLIWSRFVASQMAGARFHDTTVTVACGRTQWKAKGERLLFPGFLAVLPRGKDEGDAELPPLEAGQTLKLEKLDKEQKFTQPPARYSEASLVRELEEQGIGRPSTYASIISTLQDREYVRLQDRHFIPTDLGRVVCEQLVQHFPHLMDVGFTAEMESLLDKVADGDQQWVDLMHAFAADFNPTLAAAAKNMQSVKGGLPTDLACPDCGKPLMIKFGKAGPFLACSGYPDCRFTSNFQRTEDGRLEIVAPQKPELEKVGECPRCGKDLVIKHARTGSRFIACTGYPDCNYTAPMATGVMCPRCGEGRMVEKSTKRGKLFYSCDRYPQCDFALWDKPVPGPCPRCNSSYLVEKRGRDGSVKIMCPTKGCGYVKGGDDGQDA